MQKLKTYLFLFLLIELLFSYAPAYAQNPPPTYSGVEAQITKYLCTPKTPPASQTAAIGSGTGNNFVVNSGGTNNNGGVLFQCINQIYKFAIIVAAVVGVFFIVIAGYIYMSAEGNSESSTKAKDILVTTLTSLVILMAGYILLKALNPDLIQFHSIQPPSVSTVNSIPVPVAGAPGAGGAAGATITGNKYILGGFDIAPYATDPSHEALVAQIYSVLASKDFSSPSSIDQYLKRVAPTTPLTGNMVFSSAQKYNVDGKLMVALMQTDSSLGTAGKGATSNNPGNVGSTSSGSQYDIGNLTKTYPDWQSGVDAVANWLSLHRA